MDASPAGLYGNAGQGNYSAGKAGILGLAKAVAKEWGRCACRSRITSPVKCSRAVAVWSADTHIPSIDGLSAAGGDASSRRPFGLSSLRGFG
ncbi:hypothetical protein GCM10011610_55830 [Nocardia rhizosphaerihabitans]|uniref:Uncharacterized protein n=1 Tax=Nocardia rhizosphaerihabitans TaxID=1691570 RepID=A0ABQ2KUK2_9NOCA|nr:hypothetical protein GCM10011610_55830 [Nocardia rhizosphaerihabitans]